jgi:hypothetical protein
MSSELNSNLKELEIPNDSKDVLTGVSLRIKDKLIKITFSQKFKEIEVLYIMDSISDLSKIIKGVRKKVKSKVPEMKSEEDLYKIEDVLLRNYQLFKPENLAETVDNDLKQAQNIRPDISPIEWQKTLQEKYEILRETTLKNFSDVWQAIEFALSVKNVLHIQGNSLPFIGIILGPPGSSKTLALQMLRKLMITFYTDNFTAKSFVSHNTAVSQEQLAKIDMLPKIKDKLFITPELAPLFNGKDDDLLSVLGIVTRIADGQGFESDSGAYGHRGYSGEHMFAWIGAAVDIPYKVYKHLSALGPKLYFIRMETKEETENDYLYELKYGNFNDSKKQVEDALLDYMKWFDYCPIGEFQSSVMKIKCESSDNDDYSLRIIIKLGELLRRLRGFAPTWETHGTQGSNYAYSHPIIEKPRRAMENLRNLAIGHALSKGRLSINSEDIPIIIKVALSTAPVERVNVFDLLINKNGTLTTSEIMDFLNASRPTAIRTMTELKVLGLVNMDQGSGENDNSPLSIKLKDKFKWFLSDEFKRLRGGFIPEKFEECKEKSPPPTLKKYDDTYENLDFEALKDVFWKSFEGIEEEEKKASPILGPKLIKRVKLTNELLNKTVIASSEDSPTVITAEVVDKIINKLVREGKLAEPRKGQYYKITRDNKSAAATAAA